MTNGANRVNITNNSNAPGILVSGTNQQVGNIDGSGTTQVNAGSDLMANHIVQGALVIGGTEGNPALVTIDASDASGNPLASGLFQAGSLTSSDPFGPGVSPADVLADSMSEGFAFDFSAHGSSTATAGLAVPEPASVFLLAIGGLTLGGLAIIRREQISLN